jgi:hypothetical protein
MTKKIQAIKLWKVKEFEKKPKNFKFYLILYILLFSLAIYGLIFNNLLLSILIILFGFVFFLFEKKEPEDMTFAITQNGILVHDDLHPYESIESFWIDYQPNGIKEISFKSNQLFTPYIKIPLYENNPNEIRKILLKFLPEKEHSAILSDIFDRF